MWRRAFLRLVPPPRLPLYARIEAHLRLPANLGAMPGAVRLWPYQRAIADAIGDSALERMTLAKSMRAGFITLLTGALGSFVANKPAPILAPLPIEADSRDYVVSDVEPIFETTPALCGLLAADTEGGNRKARPPWRQREGGRGQGAADPALPQPAPSHTR